MERKTNNIGPPSRQCGCKGIRHCLLCKPEFQSNAEHYSQGSQVVNNESYNSEVKDQIADDKNDKVTHEIVIFPFISFIIQMKNMLIFLYKYNSILLSNSVQSLQPTNPNFSKISMNNDRN